MALLQRHRRCAPGSVTEPIERNIIMHVYVKGLMAAVAAGTAAVTLAACGSAPAVHRDAAILPAQSSFVTTSTAPPPTSVNIPAAPKVAAPKVAPKTAAGHDANDDRVTGVDNDANDDRVTGVDNDRDRAGVDNDANDDRVTGIDNDNDANDDRVTGVDNDRDRGGDNDRGGEGHGGGGGHGGGPGRH
jgi:hypothetical protein